MRALILSAGLGERLRPLTLKKAKPAVEFLNIPMLGFPYYWLNTLGLDQLVFNTHYLPETVRHAAMHVVPPSLPLHFSHEEAILGSGGGIWKARAFLDGDDHFAVANGDGVILCEHKDTLEKMFRFHKERNALATLLVCPLEGVGTKLPGVWMDNTGEVVNFGKAAQKPHAQCFHYASYMIFAKRIWDYLPEGSSNILYDVLEPRIREGEKVYGYRVDDMRWFETGNIPEYLQATKSCLEFIRDGHRLGACARDIIERLAPSHEINSDLTQMRLIADSAEVSAAAKLEGFQVIGEDARVANGARVQDSVILPLAVAPAGASVKNEVLI